MAISIQVKGDYSRTIRFLERAKEVMHRGDLNKYGQLGLDALIAATPVDSGLTASSWGYRITHSDRGSTIEWYNTNNVNGVNIAVILQYGHATKDGHFVQGVDYINPALKPVFDAIAEDAWREVTGR